MQDYAVLYHHIYFVSQCIRMCRQVKRFTVREDVNHKWWQVVLRVLAGATGSAGGGDNVVVMVSTSGGGRWCEWFIILI